MKNYPFQFTLTLLFCICFTGLKAQTLYIRPNTGTQTAYPIENIKKLIFSGGNLVVINTTGTNGAFTLFSLRYLNFTDLALATTPNELVRNSFYLYPNPVSDILNLSNPDQTETITHLQIFSLEGRLLLDHSQFTTNAPQLEVSFLPKGIYCCKITTNNKSQTIKFLKQ